MDWTHILIHHSAGTDGPFLSTPAIRRYHMEDRGWQDIGYHFVAERADDAYVVIVGRPLSMPGAHCPGMNHAAVGFCFVGDYTDTPPADSMLETAAYHIAGLCDQLGIPTSNVEPHREHRETLCPGDAFPVGRLRQMIENRRR